MKLIGLLIAIIIATWVFFDAKSRGKSHGVAFGWFLGTLFLLVIFLPLWFIFRPKRVLEISTVEKPKHCDHCGKQYEGTPFFCTNCGKALRE